MPAVRKGCTIEMHTESHPSLSILFLCRNDYTRLHVFIILATCTAKGSTVPTIYHSRIADPDLLHTHSIAILSSFVNTKLNYPQKDAVELQTGRWVNLYTASRCSIRRIGDHRDHLFEGAPHI